MQSADFFSQYARCSFTRGNMYHVICGLGGALAIFQSIKFPLVYRCIANLISRTSSKKIKNDDENNQI